MNRLSSRLDCTYIFLDNRFMEIYFITKNLTHFKCTQASSFGVFGVVLPQHSVCHPIMKPLCFSPSSQTWETTNLFHRFFPFLFLTDALYGWTKFICLLADGTYEMLPLSSCPRQCCAEHLSTSFRWTYSHFPLAHSQRWHYEVTW